MKNLKKLSGILLAIAVLLACTVSAFAASGNTGTITVDNPVSGHNYVAYKIFDATYVNDSDPLKITYTISTNPVSPWLSIVNEYIASGEKGISLGDEVAVEGTSNRFKIVSFTGAFSPADFASFLKGRTNPETDTPEAGTPLNDYASFAKADTLPLGYYFVNSATGTIANLTTTAPSVIIHDKDAKEFAKTDNGAKDVKVGDKVDYTITDKIPDTTGFTAYTYKITDSMTNGLKYNNDIVITIDENPFDKSDNYTQTTNGFELTIPFETLKANATKEIKITYSATVTESAVGVVSKNHAVLTYSDDPANVLSTRTYDAIEQTVYSSKIVVDKYEKGSSTTKLAGAEFVLRNSSNQYYKYDSVTKKVTWEADIANASRYTTPASGEVQFIGLADGTYYLVETAAPDGYNLLKDPFQIDVDGDGASNDKNIEQKAEEPSLLTYNQPVENSTGTLLPSTGGIGTTIFYIVGGVLVAAAVVLLVAKKRTSENR